MSPEASIHREAGSRMSGTSASAPAEAEGRLEADLRERVIDALDQVYDPELDEPITQLRFIGSCAVTADGDVDILLRLPTPQCAPNFAFLMGADSRRVVREVEGVRNVSIRFEDHYTGDEINSALNRGDGFTGAFPGETDDDDLEALREIFTRKALIGRQSKICEGLRTQGADETELVEMTVAQLPDTPETARVLELRAILGVRTDAEAPGFVQPNGEAIAADQLKRWLRAAQLVRVSLEANGEICRGLLQGRHQLAADSNHL
jgi:metal-sulfur cluster biosynthetic enzyme